MSSLSARCNFCEERPRHPHSFLCELCQEESVRDFLLARTLPLLTAYVSEVQALVIQSQAACFAVRVGNMCPSVFNRVMEELFPCKSPVYRRNTSIRYEGKYWATRCHQCWPCRRAGMAWYQAGKPESATWFNACGYCYGTPAALEEYLGIEVKSLSGDADYVTCAEFRNLLVGNPHREEEPVGIDRTLLSHLRLFGAERVLSQEQRDAARNSASVAKSLWETLPELVTNTLRVFWQEESCPRCGIQCGDIPFLFGCPARQVEWERRAILAGCCIACCCRWPRTLEDGGDKSSVSSPGLTAVWGGVLRKNAAGLNNPEPHRYGRLHQLYRKNEGHKTVMTESVS